MASEETEAELKKKEDAENDLKEVQERLEQIIKHAGTRPYEGTNPLADARRIQKDEERNAHLTSDPFNSYGYGIIAYFNMQKLLLATYVLICCLALWIMLQYNSGQALRAVDSRYYMFSRFTLGNLGAAKTACITQNLDSPTAKTAKQTLSCDPGLTISKLNESHLGVVPATEKNALFKYNDERSKKQEFFGNDFCGQRATIPDDDNCYEDIFSHEALKSDFTEKCVGL